MAVAEFGGPAVVEAVAEAAIDLPRPVARLRAAPVGKAVEVPAVADVVSDPGREDGIGPGGVDVLAGRGQRLAPEFHAEGEIEAAQTRAEIEARLRQVDDAVEAVAADCHQVLRDGRAGVEQAERGIAACLEACIEDVGGQTEGAAPGGEGAEEARLEREERIAAFGCDVDGPEPGIDRAREAGQPAVERGLIGPVLRACAGGGQGEGGQEEKAAHGGSGAVGTARPGGGDGVAQAGLAGGAGRQEAGGKAAVSSALRVFLSKMQIIRSEPQSAETVTMAAP